MTRSSEYRKSYLFRQVSRRAGKALTDHHMLRDGDKVAVAVSGGKDSLAMLHVLASRQAFIPVQVRLLAVVVDQGRPGFPAGELAEYIRSLGIPCHVESITTVKDGPWDQTNCFWCSRVRRKAIFSVAQRQGCAQVALGHHLDDIVTTILLNLFYHGTICAMKPKQELFDGKITIIRPLAYEREETLIRLHRTERWPTFDRDKCPQDATSKRKIVKQLLRQIEGHNPDAAVNVFRSLQNIQTAYLLDGSRINTVPRDHAAARDVLNAA